MLKILIVGLGSIGRRHLKYLQQIGNFELAALRSAKERNKERTDILEFYSLQDAINFGPDGVLVSNPTALHVKTALPFLKRGIRTLVEKPVAHNSIDAMLLHPYSQLVRTAYCMRFHPLNQLLKPILNEEKVFKLGFRRSFYLPNWHPYADYRNEYTARKDLGGGVVRTLSHEVDLMVHWFGKPESVVGVTDMVSDLEINTDDYAFFSCKFKNGFRVNFDLDMLSPTNINTGELYNTKGKYHWDTNAIWFTPYSGSDNVLFKSFNADTVDEMYASQMKDFVNFIETGKSVNCTLRESIDVLNIIENLNCNE